MKRNAAVLICLALIVIVTSLLVFRADHKSPVVLKEPVDVVSRPTEPFNNMGDELQVYCRLSLLEVCGYEFQKTDAVKWQKFMSDKTASLYGRMCAAYFLLDEYPEAREFIQEQFKSQNLRHRYNAARILGMYLSNAPTKKWAADLLIQALAKGDLDGSGITSSGQISGDYPDGDSLDIMLTPLNPVCWNLGRLKSTDAVPALISVLERRPRTTGAADALGVIGDQRAVPVLMKILDERTGYEHREIIALGKLKCKAAVPILISRLGHPETTFSGLDIEETQIILEALLGIGDPQALPAIEKFLEGDYPQKSKATARRVLIQLKNDDPVTSLLALLQHETYEPEKSDIVSDLTRFKDARVINTMSEIAKSSDSAFMRRVAIDALHQIGHRQALLELASLLKVKFPPGLKAEWGWKGPPPDFSKYFPDWISRCLKDSTKQDFGLDSEKWSEWIQVNVKD
jgi:HEAT repeat protein